MTKLGKLRNFSRQAFDLILYDLKEKLRNWIFKQMADGNLVHEKTRADRFFFYITTALTIAGALGSLEYFYRSSFPKRA